MALTDKDAKLASTPTERPAATTSAGKPSLFSAFKDRSMSSIMRFGVPPMWPITESATKLLWSTLTLLGRERILRLLPKPYRDTIFYFQGVDDCVALTIDDGLVRHGAQASLVEEVRELLATHNARCTFFVCSKYLVGAAEQAAALVADGHELGNHLEEDLNMVYPKLPRDDFSAALRRTTDAIEAVPGAMVRWFRAPQGYLTESMRAAVADQGLKHALGDAYCDDWALAHNAPFAARTMLKQARPGSILIMHMPEKGFREHTFRVLERVLAGLKDRGLRCVTLSEMSAMVAPTRELRPSPGAELESRL